MNAEHLLSIESRKHRQCPKKESFITRAKSEKIRHFFDVFERQNQSIFLHFACATSIPEHIEGGLSAKGARGNRSGGWNYQKA